jgi:hypothetical protein
VAQLFEAQKKSGSFRTMWTLFQHNDWGPGRIS